MTAHSYLQRQCDPDGSNHRRGRDCTADPAAEVTRLLTLTRQDLRTALAGTPAERYDAIGTALGGVDALIAAFDRAQMPASADVVGRASSIVGALQSAARASMPERAARALWAAWLHMAVLDEQLAMHQLTRLDDLLGR